MSEASGDRIILEGMQFYGYHGRNDEERVLGQPFEVDLEAELDLTAAGCPTTSRTALAIRTSTGWRNVTWRGLGEIWWRQWPTP